MKNNHKKGQVLIITIMLLATVITVVMTLSFKSTTETQVSKLEEESQRALAAAEAGLEAALIRGNVTIGAGQDVDIAGFTGIATVDTSDISGNREFTTPLLRQDEIYAFYMAAPPALTSGYWTGGGLDIYYNGSACPPTIEITTIDKNNVINRKVVDNCPNLSSGGGAVDTATAGSYTFADGTIYTLRYSYGGVAAGAEKKLIVVRILSGSTRVGFKGTSNLKAQGKIVTSEAQSTSGVTKKIRLFQSYPQFPADFFVTSF